MTKQGNPTVAKWLVVSGLFMLAVGVVIGIVLEPIYGLVALLPAVIDFALAMMYSRGIIGGTSSQAAAGATEGTPREPDYSENPYARED